MLRAVTNVVQHVHIINNRAVNSFISSAIIQVPRLVLGSHELQRLQHEDNPADCYGGVCNGRHKGKH